MNLLAIALAFALAAPAPLDSCRQARRLLDHAIEASGGLERLRKIDDVDVTYRGTRRMLNQSPRLDGPLDVEPWSGRTLVDARGNRLLGEIHATFPVEENFAFRWSLTGNEGFAFDLMKNNQGPEAVPLAGAAGTAARSSFVRNVPHLLLLQALEAAPSLRLAGEHAVSFVQPDRTLVTLRFEPKSHLLRSFDILQDDGVLGDTVATTEFLDYRRVDGVAVPGRRVESINGTVVRNLEYAVAFDTHPPDSLFALPAGYTMPAPDAPANPAVRRLADGVWIDTAAGNALFADLGDGIFVMEAPNSSASAAATIARIHETIPGKPIRWFSFSHPHTDHAGGLRAYIAEGATVITTPGLRPFVERMAAATHTIAPDALSRAPHPPRIETFEGNRTLSGNGHSIELHEIGPVSHSEEMVLAWLPAERVLFQADLFFIANTGPLGPQFHAVQELKAKLDALGIRDVDLVIDPDGTTTSGAELWRAAGAAAGSRTASPARP